jgi:hypothetical protein
VQIGKKNQRQAIVIMSEKHEDKRSLGSNRAGDARKVVYDEDKGAKARPGSSPLVFNIESKTGLC